MSNIGLDELLSTMNKGQDQSKKMLEMTEALDVMTVTGNKERAVREKLMGLLDMITDKATKDPMSPIIDVIPDVTATRGMIREILE